MEVDKLNLIDRIKSFFLKDKVPFASRADVDWKRVSKCFLIALVVGVLVLLFLPTSKKGQDSFHEKAQATSSGVYQPSSTSDATEQAVNQMNLGSVPSVPSHSESIYGGGSSGSDRSASMILTRGGQDSKTQVPAGSRIVVRLMESATVANTAMPVIGIVIHDFVQEDSLAIPMGSKLFGEVSFDGDSERAKIEWKSIELPDGRQRQFAAIGVSADGQVGVEGNIHSDGLKNTVGATLSRFVGAYAQGSMQSGFLGANPGGNDNGWKNAISETASDQANSLADNLKKEKKWIEVSAKEEFFAVLTSNFVFRDPGSTYGQ